MRFKISAGVFLLAAMFYTATFAGELVLSQAVNYFNEGVANQKANKFRDAEVAYTKTILVDPYNLKWKVLVTNNRGIMDVMSGDLDSAEMKFNQVLKYDPEYMPAKVNLGLIYDKRRSKLESLEYWLKILGIDIEKAKPQGYVISVEDKI